MPKKIRCHVKPFRYNNGVLQTDRRTNGQMDRIAIAMTRNKNTDYCIRIHMTSKIKWIVSCSQVYPWLAVWRDALVFVNEVALRSPRLVSVWVTSLGWVTHLGAESANQVYSCWPSLRDRSNEYQQQVRNKQAHHVMQQPVSVVSQCQLVSS